MRIIAIVDTEECGPYVVLDADAISVIKCSDFYMAATYCGFTGRPLTSEISKECAEGLIENGVRCLDFNEEMSLPTEISDKKSKE